MGGFQGLVKTVVGSKGLLKINILIIRPFDAKPKTLKINKTPNHP